MEITKAKQTDAQELSELLSEIISTTPYFSDLAVSGEKLKYNVQALTEKLTNPDYIFLVNRGGSGKINAICFGQLDDAVFFGNWIGVVKENRKHGVATALIEKMFTELKQRGVSRMHVHTRLGNKESIDLLLKLGFKNNGLLQKNCW